jgi:hypothetical protein
MGEDDIMPGIEKKKKITPSFSKVRPQMLRNRF